MMQPSDLRKGNHLAHLRSLDRPRHGAVIIQRLMRSREMLVVDVGPQHPTEVLLIQNNNVIEALTSNRADKSFAVRVLPRRTQCGLHLLDPKRSHPLREFTAEDGVIVANKKPRSSVEWKRLKELPSGTHTYAYNRQTHSTEQSRSLDTAFYEDEFFLVYHPQVQAQTLRAETMEALLRWRTPTGDVVPPGQFLPAEASHAVLQRP